MKVKKAIIPAAGLGTRFLPATKAMPKEMLPVVDKPTIQYIVEEAIQSGIEDIIIVTGKGKRAIEDHFDHAFELEDNLYKKGKLDLLEEVQQSAEVDIHYIRQKEPKGLGHAIWCARKFIGDEPFAVLLGDDIVRSDEPCLKQLINQYEETKSSIIGVKQVPKEETDRYGIIAPKHQEGRRYEVEHFVEKPAVNEAPSNLAIIGRYVFTPEIMDLLATQETGRGGEIQLTDAIERLNTEQPVFGYEFEGERFDVGDQMGFIKTTLAIAMEREEMREDVLALMREVIEKQKSVNI
ncbi:UTP--glucose-1-phosphate uridylyltransferase GalU [Halobacillus karajensis]|uniref:UTP--glucose-1-phosphate uridylyltransferase n=1 Tax=Halobacillus karajensis TaxID=195088 RepID=A0A059NV11_9BACI|nr:UTP--glucose-1-phosphate uridylyltransferase GalU [Halobacillus karajensis]CDQ19222.1 UTP--glucose-1-phosphate uridylyltransferase [Halobacillus karajensis]CDQ22704.1 UTP--glucose-1-phosphate uridylyltransferase [Halobacillus karajensis]CDQ26186.1 UTP--glucose-1-phosphate uridylyltransferase [Halobacillus karajensis]